MIAERDDGMREWPFKYKAASLLIAAAIGLLLLQAVLALAEKHFGVGLESVGIALILARVAIYPEMLFAPIGFNSKRRVGKA